jgi:MoxR-like ATPase
MNPVIKPIIAQVSQILLGKETKIKLSLCCLIAGGHLLIEDVPGVGKTTLANSLAQTLGLAYQRVQFTSDMLPADLLGVSIFNQESHEFIFHKGPIFSQLVLGDEINRASPKTQSALLEAMAEGQVSLDGKTHTLPHPFFVVATQNPMEHSGTFELPDSQLDRFLMRVTIGFPEADAEKAMLQQNTTIAAQSPVIDLDELVDIQQQARDVTASDAVIDYILRLVGETRNNNQYVQALSPRASRALLAASKAWAFIMGRRYVLPEDVQAVLPAVCEHRLRGGNHSQSQSLSEQLLHSVNPLA